ncbi:MAG TPA: hypothetical protein VJU34_10635, partial [Phenylobacterium sp.]|nr:hypothetical protein [Phenylobacterium sp.]
FNRPTSDDYLIEQPLALPQSWIAIGAESLPAHPVSRSPFESAGFVTFGTASQPYKIGPQVLMSWARIVAATPNSRFAFVRPEAASAVFRTHVQAAFAQAGVAADRLIWRPVRGAHLPYYGEIDVSLDTFPLTGGATTIEALWMGVPVVSRVGEMFHERLSYSLLRNVGLEDLCVGSTADYEAVAVRLAQDGDRLRAIRAGLRDAILGGPLGQPEAFARAFYEAAARIAGS